MRFCGGIQYVSNAGSIAQNTVDRKTLFPFLCEQPHHVSLLPILQYRLVTGQTAVYLIILLMVYFFATCSIFKGFLPVITAVNTNQSCWEYCEAEIPEFRNLPSKCIESRAYIHA